MSAATTGTDEPQQNAPPPTAPDAPPAEPKAEKPNFWDVLMRSLGVFTA